MAVIRKWEDLMAETLEFDGQSVKKMTLFKCECGGWVASGNPNNHGALTHEGKVPHLWVRDVFVED